MNDKPEPVSNGIVWAFDLGKGSIGEAVRQGTKFLHKASLLIPAEFAETKTAAGRHRMLRTREVHKTHKQSPAGVTEAAIFRLAFVQSPGNIC